MTTWFEFPELPTVDEEGDSGYLLILCDRAFCPVAGYFDGNQNKFYQLGCPGLNELRGVRAWTYMIKAPARLWPPHQRRMVAELIEEE